MHSGHSLSQDILLKGILQIVEANMDLEPLHFLSFPIVLGAPTAAGASPGPRQNGTAGGGGKGVGLLWKGKLSPRRDGDSEPRTNHLRTSPWHASPLHLPLVGQNCWPHMASGFSASMWLRLTEPVEKERDGEKDKGETPGGTIVRSGFTEEEKSTVLSCLLFCKRFDVVLSLIYTSP